MKYQETNDYSFLLGSDYFIYRYEEDACSLHLYVKSRKHRCKCPKCGQESDSLHATYKRKLQDTPIRAKQTFLHATVYKYNCTNPACSCKVFMEELPFAKASQVRTDALNALILSVSMFLSKEGASKVLSLLGIDVSNDTIQRMYDRIVFEDDPDVEAVGIDDVAIRKGQTYATAIYDLKDHHLIALLEGREAEGLKTWLREHKKIQLVTRDRASAYASAIQAVLPDCVQVADRFHLLQNLLGKLNDIFKAEMPSKIYIRDGKVLDRKPEDVIREKHPETKHLSTLHYDNEPPKTPEGVRIEYNDRKYDPDAGNVKKRAQNRKKNNR